MLRVAYHIKLTNMDTGKDAKITRTNGMPYTGFKSAMGAVMENIHINTILNGPATFRIDVQEIAEDDRGHRRFFFFVEPTEVDSY